MPNQIMNPDDGINTPLEHRNYAMLIMNTAFAEGAISAKKAAKLTGLDIEDALSLLLDLESSGALRKNSVSKFEPIIEKSEWFERFYDFFEGHS